MSWNWDTEEMKEMLERVCRLKNVKVTRSKNPNREELDRCAVCSDLIPCGYTVSKGRKSRFLCSPGCGIDFLLEEPEDVFPKIEKTWTMEVRNNENVTRYTTYTAPHGKVKLVRGEQRNRMGKWRTLQWRVYEWYQGRMECTVERKTRSEAARAAMTFAREWAAGKE